MVCQYNKPAQQNISEQNRTFQCSVVCIQLQYQLQSLQIKFDCGGIWKQTSYWTSSHVFNFTPERIIWGLHSLLWFVIWEYFPSSFPQYQQLILLWISIAITMLYTDSTDPCEGTLSDTEGRILIPDNKGREEKSILLQLLLCKSASRNGRNSDVFSSYPL